VHGDRIRRRRRSREAAALAAFEDCMEQGWVQRRRDQPATPRRSSCGACAKASPKALARYKPYKNDVSVRISAMPAFLAETQALIGQAYPHFEVVWFGHIGDGNLHINVLKPEDTSDDEFVRQCEHVTKLLARCCRVTAASRPSTASAWSRSRIWHPQRGGNRADARRQTCVRPQRL
jgi:FAD/FMN-containing dehydrogenase